jgi:hypothetical protein
MLPHEAVVALQRLGLCVAACLFAALARLAKVGAKPIAKSPIALPDHLGKGLFLTCVRDPDGNLVELIGPRASR